MQSDLHNRLAGKIVRDIVGPVLDQGGRGSLLNKKALGWELCMDEAEIDDLVRLRTIPFPTRKRAGEPVWNWGEIERCIARCPTIGTIYVAGFGGYVKIGFTAGPVRLRLRNLQVGAPQRIELITTLEGTRRDEAGLHRRFAEHAASGEWFRFEGSLREWIARGCPP